MSPIKAIPLILLTAILVCNKAYCQEETNDQQIKTIVGQVTKMDIESGVVNVILGSVTKQDFSDAHFDAEALWAELIKDGYIDPNGLIQDQFYDLVKFKNMFLSNEFNGKKKWIYAVFQKALTSNGRVMVFYITNDSNLLRGTHLMASIEIEPGDPVVIRYDSSSSQNNIIRLVDNKSG